MIYSLENPLKINRYYDFKGFGFTGVVKDSFDNVAFYKQGHFHREDGPAIMFNNGDFIYLINDNVHNEKAAAKKVGNDLYYYLNNKCYGSDFTSDSWNKFVLLKIFI